MSREVPCGSISDVDVFVFHDEPERLLDESDRLARIASGITSEDELFAALSDALRFPGYFGRNWDAVDECLGDLSWIPSGRIVLVHADMPRIGPRAMATYLDSLATSAINAPHHGHRWLVVFPTACAGEIRALIPEAASSREHSNRHPKHGDPTEDDMRRRELLEHLVAYSMPFEELQAALAAFRWDARPLVSLKKEHIVDALERCRTGMLSRIDVETWANMIEGRDDVEVEADAKQALFALANPAIEGEITPQLVASMLRKLRAE